jgi:hypothetical protein
MKKGMAAKNEKQDRKYNRLKEYDGSRYSGMKIGGAHKWYYDKGEWKERKMKPDEWDIYYETTKRRAGYAPEYSGAPVGTSYNWLIVTHQRVDKLDANSYMTRMEGMKFKVAHKRTGNDKWNITEKTQRKKVITFLEQVIDELKALDEDTQVPFTVGERKRIYGLAHRTKKELYEMAAEQGVKNRSRMKRGELLKVIRDSLKEDLDGKGSKNVSVAQNLSNKSKDDLYRIAAEKHIRGRSKMKKDDLIKVLKKNISERELAL